MSAISDLILADGPALYWKLGSEISGTSVPDSSGNGNTGQIYTGQVVSAGGVIIGQNGGTRGGERALEIRGSWSGVAPNQIQSMAGTGVRADSYKPYVSGSKRTFECFCFKIDPYSFATMFSGSGGSGGAAGAPHPTLEWGATSGPAGYPLARWYGTVNTYPLGWIDWGTSNTNSPVCDFVLREWHHVVLTFDDGTGTAELWINGRSQGAQVNTVVVSGSTTGASHYDTLADPGTFQIGWRGGAPLFANPGNSEVWGGLFQHVVVYEKILNPLQIRNHFVVGRPTAALLRMVDTSNAQASIERSLAKHFRGV